MTDLDELKTLWREHDRKLDAVLRINHRLLEEVSLRRARSALAGLRATLGVELAANAVAVALLAAYVVARVDEPRFALPGVALWIGAIAAVVGDVRQLVAGRVSLDEPVLAAQRRLEQLRGLRASCVRWTLIVAPLAWTPLAIVALDCAGVDAWVVPGPAWLAANLAFGVVMLAGGWWLSVQYAARWAGSPRLRRLTDALSGRGVADAAAALRRVAEFEVEA